MHMAPGTLFASTTCTTQVVAVRVGPDPVTIACGGREMVPAEHLGTQQEPSDPALMGGTLIGKRYVDESGAWELLCTRGGDGTLTCDGVPMSVKEARPLPASD